MGEVERARQELHEELTATKEAVEAALEQYLPAAEGPAAALGQAVRHSLRGGKRVRPLLVRLAASTWGLDADDVVPTACAFELFHTATLIHDDLPAIDNSDLRRGQPSCHAAFDEPTAILAGDALILAALRALADQASRPATPPQRVALVLGDFALAAQAVIAGEAVDITAEGLPPSAELLDFIHRNKTAALLAGAARAGALLAGAPAEEVALLDEYAQGLGLLFQVTDDLLDVEGSAGEMGKPTGQDAQAGKQTYPAVYGVEEAHRRAQELAGRLRELAQKLPSRWELWQALVEVVLERRS
ncbi:MAG: polyprenyl synthetase family protein [Armatimonadetes bacterium]|nr:polyprenyl synthetase family protein [Armatimonadota bacterium]